MKTKKPETIYTYLVSGLIALSALGIGPVQAHNTEHPSDMSVHAKPHQHQQNAKADQKPWGIAGQAKKVSRTISVSMGDDFRFQPARLDIRQNETIRFVVKNTGKVLHEFVIGTPSENAQHAKLMLKFPNMTHDEPYMAHVKAGSTEEVIWTFNTAGQFEFACLVGGHHDAGMKGTIVVQAISKQ